MKYIFHFYVYLLQRLQLLNLKKVCIVNAEIRSVCANCCGSRSTKIKHINDFDDAFLALFETLHTNFLISKSIFLLFHRSKSKLDVVHLAFLENLLKYVWSYTFNSVINIVFQTNRLWWSRIFSQRLTDWCLPKFGDAAFYILHVITKLGYITGYYQLVPWK